MRARDASAIATPHGDRLMREENHRGAPRSPLERERVSLVLEVDVELNRLLAVIAIPIDVAESSGFQGYAIGEGYQHS
jgi:hypothetical protein